MVNKVVEAIMKTSHFNSIPKPPKKKKPAPKKKAAPKKKVKPKGRTKFANNGKSRNA